MRLELPGKVLPPLPRRTKEHGVLHSTEDDDDSISSESASSKSLQVPESTDSGTATPSSGGGLRSWMFGGGHKRNASATSLNPPIPRSPRLSGESMSFKEPKEPKVLYREPQRVSLRAFLRTFLQNEQIAQSHAMADFLTSDPIVPNEEEMDDMERRKTMDEKRLDEQARFYEIARKRAAELDVHMENFRREIIERSMCQICVRSHRKR
jgi:hypothetical protein